MKTNYFLIVILIVLSFGILADKASAGTADVSWNANTEPDLASYKIYYGTSSRTGIDPKVCGACGYSSNINVGNVTSHVFSGLTDGQTYYFSVSAIDNSGNESSFSSEVSKPIPVPDTTPPVRSSGSPTTQLAANTTQANLSLTTNENATCKYSTSAGTAYFSMANTFSTTGNLSHSTVVSGLQNSQSYQYYIKCMDTSDNPNSDDYTISFSVASSPPVSDTSAPSTPTNLAATAVSSSQINLSWTASTDNTGVTGYRIYREGVQIAISTTNSYSNTGLNSSTTYLYTVAAYDAAGNVSGRSNSASATTQAAPTTTQTGTSGGGGSNIPTTPTTPTTPTVPIAPTTPVPTTPAVPAAPVSGSGSSVNLLRAASDAKVYEIINTLKHWIPNPTVFNAYGFSWSNVRVVTNEEANKYSRAKLLRAQGDVKVYYLTEAGQIRHIPNPEIFNSYPNNKWEDILTVSQAEIDSYPISNLIRLESGTKVYKLENGKKRWITTAEAFNRLKYDWTKIAPTNQTELNYYPEGTVIN